MLAAGAFVILLLGGALWLAWTDTRPAASAAVDSTPAGPSASVSVTALEAELLTDGAGDLTRLVEIHTTIPERPNYDIKQYTVVKSDTVFVIANKFQLKPETIVWGNPVLIENPNALYVNQVLNILPIDGALRVVQPGDTVEKIAKYFHGTVDEIVTFPGNDLDPEDPALRPGENLIIPGGWRDLLTWELPVVTRDRPAVGACGGRYTGPIGTYTFIWPGSIHSVSGNEYIPKIHPGIDISAWTGMPVYASDTGVVVYAGWNDSGYGFLVIIDHGNGWQTAYAHNSQINARCGQTVYQGDVIALAGSTGRSTGAHIHFEMRSDLYGRVNPWLYLPPP